jgi:AcrR family transcriptional regulator
MGRPPRITREQLLETARRVFVAKGFETTTLADIASELGVTAAAVLRHFPSKHELFIAAIHSGSIELPPFLTELATIDPATDPRVVLRGVAERVIPFVQKTIATTLAVYMHNRAQTSFVVPFDTTSENSPPKRALRALTEYFRRASDAGVVRVRDPRAAALLFVGSLQSYVFLHYVLNIAPKPYPLDAWIDQLIDIWTSGAIVTGGTRDRKAKPVEKSRADRGAGDRGVRRVRVHSPDAAAQTARPRRNARSANGSRGVAVRRPRRPRSDR